MKLLSKTNRYYLVYSTILLACGGLIFYQITSFIIKNEVGEILENELAEWQINADEDSTYLHPQRSIELEVSRIGPTTRTDALSDTLVQEKGEDEMIPYLQLTAVRKINGKWYRVIMRESLIESEDILFGVAVSMVIIFAVMLVGLVLLNNYLSKELWKPFYANLQAVKNFNLHSEKTMKVVPSEIQEFKELNTTLLQMTHRISKDYEILKEFTENASHEIQTPIAIIRSKIDWLLQSVKEEQSLEDLIKIEKAANRIARTNQALLLLTKIENRQFTNQESIRLDEIIDQCLDDFEEFIDSKGLAIHYDSQVKVGKVKLNKSLAQVLINNLMSNAIKHNINGGYITIKLENDKLVIENTGHEIDIQAEKLFDRFTKGDQSSESTGLGLAIVKQICEVMNLNISYNYEKKVHRLTIVFSQ